MMNYILLTNKWALKCCCVVAFLQTTRMDLNN